MIDSFTCPDCGAVSYHPADVRFGYCGRCRAFTGDPTDFIFVPTPGGPMTPEQEEFSARCRDAMRHHPVPIRVLTDEEREEMWEQNLRTFRSEERIAIAIERPESFADRMKAYRRKRRTLRWARVKRAMFWRVHHVSRWLARR